MNQHTVEQLLLQSLEHEMGGTKIYDIALQCAVNKDLKEEWRKYSSETENHVSKLKEVCQALSIDPDRETPGRKVVRKVGQALQEAMQIALAEGDRKAAEIVAAECVVLAETKDHLDWELLAECAEHLDGSAGATLRSAVDEGEDQEDQHLYHTRGFCRELWIQSLGMKAVLPPLEEQQNVKTAVGAARAEKASERERE
jgi:hypothetical protein